MILAVELANFSSNHTHLLHAHRWIAHSCMLAIESPQYICTSVHAIKILSTLVLNYNKWKEGLVIDLLLDWLWNLVFGIQVILE